MISDVFTQIAKPLIEVRGLADSEAIRTCILKELSFCALLEVDNFGMLDKYEKPPKQDNKQFNIQPVSFRKYLNCTSACWLELFIFSPLESVDSQISEDISVASKFALSKGKRYLSIIVCPDQSAFAARLAQIKTASRTNVVIMEGPQDATAISK